MSQQTLADQGKPAKVLTERELLAMLRKRHGAEHGNGPEWAVVEHVRNAAGFDASRTIDAIAMTLWPSRGLRLHAYEIKCDRRDWLRELKDPAKAEGFCAMVDHFWLVVAGPGIVQDGELPPTWGLLAPRGRKLVQIKAAPLLHPELTGKRSSLPDGFGRGFLAALLRRVVDQHATPEEIREAREEAEARARESAHLELENERALRRDAEERIRLFEQAAHVPISGWHARQTPQEVGAAVRAALEGEHSIRHVQQRLEGLRNQAQRLAEHIDEELARFAPEEARAA